MKTVKSVKKEIKSIIEDTLGDNVDYSIKNIKSKDGKNSYLKLIIRNFIGSDEFEWIEEDIVNRIDATIIESDYLEKSEDCYIIFSY